MTYILTRPILALREMAQRVASGELEVRARVWAKDEIGQLASAINMMTDRLVSSRKDLERTNRRLSAINQIALAADEQTDIHDVLYDMLEKILEVVHLQTGWVYLLDPERQHFHLASWFGVPETMKDCLLHDVDQPLCECQNKLLLGDINRKKYHRECSRLKMGDCSGWGYDTLTLPSKHATRDWV